MKTILFLFSFFIFSNYSFAEIKAVKPIAVSDGLVKWGDGIDETIANLKDQGEYSQTGYTECAEAKEVPSAFLCFSSERKLMNLALTRASIYSEGTVGVPAGTVVRLDDKAVLNLAPRIAGHDITSPVLAEFYTRLSKACADSKNDGEVCPNANEKEFFEQYLVPKINSGKPFVLITTVPNIPDFSASTIVSHEILHAQYFLNATYRNTVDNFWNKTLTEEERTEARDALGEGYDATNEYVMRNEFQAYLLMNGAKESFLSFMVEKQEPLLRAALAKAKTPAVKINTEKHLTHGLFNHIM
jgi:hypothetical protein